MSKSFPELSSKKNNVKKTVKIKKRIQEYPVSFMLVMSKIYIFEEVGVIKFTLCVHFF